MQTVSGDRPVPMDPRETRQPSWEAVRTMIGAQGAGEGQGALEMKGRLLL